MATLKQMKRGLEWKPTYDQVLQSYLSGGAGLTMSGSGSFSVNTSNGVKIDGDDVELDYEVVSSAPTGVGSSSVGHLWFVIWYVWRNLYKSRVCFSTTVSRPSHSQCSRTEY